MAEARFSKDEWSKRLRAATTTISISFYGKITVNSWTVLKQLGIVENMA